MSRPLFEVGEEVIVTPLGKPAFGAVVINIVWGPGIGITRGSGERAKPGWEYFTSPDNSDRPDLPWVEYALKKRPPLGDSFTQLLQDLKNPIKNSEPA